MQSQKAFVTFGKSMNDSFRMFSTLFSSPSGITSSSASTPVDVESSVSEAQHHAMPSHLRLLLKPSRHSTAAAGDGQQPPASARERAASLVGADSHSDARDVGAEPSSRSALSTGSADGAADGAAVHGRAGGVEEHKASVDGQSSGEPLVAATPSAWLCTRFSRVYPDVVWTSRLAAEAAQACWLGCCSGMVPDLVDWLSSFQPDAPVVSFPVEPAFGADIMGLCTLFVEACVSPASVPHGVGLRDSRDLLAFVHRFGRLSHVDRLVAACVTAGSMDALAAAVVRSTRDSVVLVCVLSW